MNVTGFFRITQRVVAEMLKGSGGHIVNITTTLADYADADVPSVLVSLTKGGLASATKSLAIEYATRGIRVNAVSPGVIQTSMNAADSYDADAALEPLGRVGQISDIVDGILFLESSPFITGEILHIDGGQTPVIDRMIRPGDAPTADRAVTRVSHQGATGRSGGQDEAQGTDVDKE